jgi:hypothetical protein
MTAHSYGQPYSAAHSTRDALYSGDAAEASERVSGGLPPFIKQGPEQGKAQGIQQARSLRSRPGKPGNTGRAHRPQERQPSAHAQIGDILLPREYPIASARRGNRGTEAAHTVRMDASGAHRAHRAHHGHIGAHQGRIRDVASGRAHGRIRAH